MKRRFSSPVELVFFVPSSSVQAASHRINHIRIPFLSQSSLECSGATAHKGDAVSILVHSVIAATSRTPAICPKLVKKYP